MTNRAHSDAGTVVDIPHYGISGLQLFERSGELQKYNHARITRALTEASRATRTRIAEAAIRDARAAAFASAAAASAARRRAARLAREAEAADRRAAAPALASALLEARTRGFVADQRAADARSRAALAAEACRRAAAAAAAREEWLGAMRRVALQQALDAAATARLAAKNGAKAARAEAVAAARCEILSSLRASAGACSRAQQRLRERLFAEELALRRSPERMRRAAAELVAERRRILAGEGEDEAEVSDESAESSPRRAEGGRGEVAEVVVEVEEEASVEVGAQAPSLVAVGCLPLRTAVRTEAERQQAADAPPAAPAASSPPLPAPPAQFRSKIPKERKKLSCFGRSPAKGEEEEEVEVEAEAQGSAAIPAAASAVPAAPAPVLLTAASTSKKASARPTINLTATTATVAAATPATTDAADSSSPARNFFMFACASPPKTGGARNGGAFVSAWAATAEA